MAITFNQDKRSFFSSDNSFQNIDAVKNHFLNNPADHSFKYLSNHRRSIEHELNESRAYFKKQSKLRANQITADQLQYWFFCYYNAFLLKTYYETYSPEKAVEYENMCIDIEADIEKESNHSSQHLLQKSPPESLLTQLRLGFYYALSTPFSVERFRKLLGQVNMQRLSTRFSLLTLKQSLLLAEQWHWLDCLQSMFGYHINLAHLDAPLGVYNALSVGLCGMRFILDVAMLIKHTCFPVGADGIKEQQLTCNERAWVEIQQHYYHLVNDMVWSTVNALCNYGNYFHIGAATATSLMVGFTVFDIAWLYYLLTQIDADFEQKREEKRQYMKTLDHSSSAYQIECALFRELELQAEKTRTEYVFYIWAACLLECGFLASFVLMPPAWMPLGLLICNMAIAMSLSAGAYATYREQCLSFKINQLDQNQGYATKDDVHQAWNDLVWTLGKNVTMPLVLWTAFAINTPLALLVTAGYIAHECGLIEDYLPSVSGNLCYG